MKPQKTNAMRNLESLKIPYEQHTYEAEDGAIDAVAVAKKVGRDPGEVFKTLVLRGASGAVFVCVIPADSTLDMKAAARGAKEKSAGMLPLTELTQVTGYVRGGCSPIGMKKRYLTLVDETAQLWPRILVSGGKIGLQIELDPEDLLRAADARYSALVQE